MSQTAVIIKGNPQLIRNNPMAKIFYSELGAFLQTLGFTVTFDSGTPHTTPPQANLWVGHSRGADRLRFAPPETTVIGIGVPESSEGNPFPVVNHPHDPQIQRTYHEGRIIQDSLSTEDPNNHYRLTSEMKTAIRKLVEK